MDKPTPHSALTPIAVFDAPLPPAIAFVRSLGRVGVPVTVYADEAFPAARASRFTSGFHRCPPLAEVDAFLPWLGNEVAAGRIALAAPTSDLMAFYLGALRDEFPEPSRSLLPTLDSILDCLCKDRFADAITRAGFPVPRMALPVTAADAVRAADDLGYPLLMKPRSHLGVGLDRGNVVRTRSELESLFRPYPVPPGQRSVIERYPELSLPMLQQYLDPAEHEVVSISGYVSPQGDASELSVSTKRALWPPRVGIGTLFERVPMPSYGQRVAEAASALVRGAIFELEVLVRTRTGDQMAIDLNPRAFGQISLDIASGHDLPARWYEGATCARLPERHVGRAPRYWVQGTPYVVGELIQLWRQPSRVRRLARLMRSPELRLPVHAAFRWDDPLPGVFHASRMLRHPGGLVRPFLRD